MKTFGLPLGFPKSLPPFLRRRLPFLPLVFCASAGILLAECLPALPLLYASLAALSFLLFLGAPRLPILRRTALAGLAFALFLSSSFALLHLWQTRDSPGLRLAASIPPEGIIASASGIVISEPRVFSPDFSSFELRLLSLQTSHRSLPCRNTTILVNWKGPPPSYGDKISAQGALSAIPPPRNPGQFDFASWQARRGIHSLLALNHPRDGLILARGQGNPLVAAALASRRWMSRTLSSGINDPVISTLILGMVLGDTSSLPNDVKEEFRGTGTFHLFSVSGLHVGILALILWQVFKPLRIPRRMAAGLIIPLLFFYVLMTGLQPAGLRSAIMASIVLIGFMTNRPPMIFNSVCAAAFFILLADTNQLFNAGFQLSFTVVAAIILLSKPFHTLLERPILPDPFFPRKLLSPAQRLSLQSAQKIAALSSVSLAAWLGSLPLTISYFHMVSLSALPANLVAVPLSFIIMAVSMLSLGSGLFSLWLSEVFNQVNWLLATLLLGTTHFLASLPGAYFYIPLPRPAAPPSELIVFDCGAGGALWLQTQGRHWVIDPGSLRFHDNVLIPFLRSQGLRSLDGCLLTHGDAGHIGGAESLLSTCPPAVILDSAMDDRSPVRGRLHAGLAQSSRPKSIVRSGDTLRLSPASSLHILYPPADAPGTTADDKAIVARLDIGATRILLLSDSGTSTEQWLLQHKRGELPCDIVIKGSHRSGPSTFIDLLQIARPRVVIASAADFPSSEQIPENWARSLKAKGIQLFRQDHTGAVAISIHPDYWRVSSFLNHQSYLHSK